MGSASASLHTDKQGRRRPLLHSSSADIGMADRGGCSNGDPGDRVVLNVSGMRVKKTFTRLIY